jgi:hypothetical protein
MAKTNSSYDHYTENIRTQIWIITAPVSELPLLRIITNAQRLQQAGAVISVHTQRRDDKFKLRQSGIHSSGKCVHAASSDMPGVVLQ